MVEAEEAEQPGWRKWTMPKYRRLSQELLTQIEGVVIGLACADSQTLMKIMPLIASILLHSVVKPSISSRFLWRHGSLGHLSTCRA